MLESKVGWVGGGVGGGVEEGGKLLGRQEGWGVMGCQDGGLQRQVQLLGRRCCWACGYQGVQQQ